MNAKLQQKLLEDAKYIQKWRYSRKCLHITYILEGNKTIAVGFNNKRKTHPASPHKWQTVHSELDAILRIRISDECKKYHFENIAEIASKYTLVNIRVYANGNIAMSKPCKYCKQLLDALQFKAVYYTTYEGHFVKL